MHGIRLWVALRTAAAILSVLWNLRFSHLAVLFQCLWKSLHVKRDLQSELCYLYKIFSYWRVYSRLYYITLQISCQMLGIWHSMQFFSLKNIHCEKFHLFILNSMHDFLRLFLRFPNEIIWNMKIDFIWMIPLIAITTRKGKWSWLDAINKDIVIKHVYSWSVQHWNLI